MHSFIISYISWSFLLWLLSSTCQWSQVEATKNEDTFVELYGDVISSGIWERLPDIHNETQILRNVCTQAHFKTQRVAGDVKIYRCDHKKLKFSNPKYKSIDMEVIIYSIEGNNKDDGSPRYFYIGKGLAPDCIFYLKPEDSNEGNFILDDHVCGIIM